MTSSSLFAISTKDVAVVSWTDTLADACRLMLRLRIRHLPVLDSSERLVGVLSDRDLLRAAREERVELFSASAATLVFDPEDLVRDWMSWPVETIDEAGTIAEAARLMVERSIACLLVTREQNVVAIVTSTDLLKVLMNQDDGPLHRAADAVGSAFARWPVGQVAQSIADVGI
jgi:CBS domain-containing protein